MDNTSNDNYVTINVTHNSQPGHAGLKYLEQDIALEARVDHGIHKDRI